MPVMFGDVGDRLIGTWSVIVSIVLSDTFLAHELRAWLLHYSAVVLQGILHEDYYQHHLLLIEGIFLLLSDSISESDIVQSSQVLNHYCYLIPFLYGEFDFMLVLHYKFLTLKEKGT